VPHKGSVEGFVVEVTHHKHGCPKPAYL